MEAGMAWTYLMIASILEIGWAVGLKYTAGFTRLMPSILVAIGILGSFWLVARAAREIPIGTAYAVFTGIGTGGTGILGILLFDESAGLFRMLSLAAIVLGVAGLKIFSGPVPSNGSIDVNLGKG
jgi:quaternary ammonium compound-resistance protein SugE